MKGSIGWQASPSSVTRLVDQRRHERLVDRGEDGPYLWVPALVLGQRGRHVTPVCPGLGCPAVLHHDRDEVDELLVAHEVVDDVATRPHPHLRGDLEVEI